MWHPPCRVFFNSCSQQWIVLSSVMSCPNHFFFIFILTSRLHFFIPLLRSILNTSNESFTYEIIIGPMWYYGIQDLRSVQAFHYICLHQIVSTPRYIESLIFTTVKKSRHSHRWLDLISSISFKDNPSLKSTNKSTLFPWNSYVDYKALGQETTYLICLVVQLSTFFLCDFQTHKHC